MRSRPPTASWLSLPSGQLPLDRVVVMGILNITPDSFYDRGRYGTLDLALARAAEMAEEGVDVIDIGGERAGPGDPVSIDEEIRRVVPLIEAAKREVSLPVSVDTFKPEVARAAIAAGADIVNSIGGFAEPAMREVAATSGAAIVVMHIQGRPRVAHPEPAYDDLVEDVARWLFNRADECIAAGISADKIIVDPGPGFGKTAEHDLTLVANIARLTEGSYPVLLAASRKPFIGAVLGSEPEARLAGSLAVVAWAVLHGVKIVRVHDVRASRRVVQMIEAVLRPELVGERR